MKKIISLLLHSAVYFVLIRFLLWCSIFISLEFIDSINFHPTDYWGWILFWWAIPLFAALLLGAKFRVRYSKSLGYVLFPLLIAGTLIGGYYNNQYWGHWMKRTAVFSELKDIEKLESVTKICKTIDEPQFEKDSIVLELSDLYYSKEYYYLDLNRSTHCLLHQDFSRKDIQLAAQYPNQELSSGLLRLITPLILQSKVMQKAESDKYFRRANRFGGRIIDFKTTKGESYYYIVLRSGEISNDHYPVYEFLVSKESPMQIVKQQVFFYDVAGMDGGEYANFAAVCEFVLLLGLMLIVGMFHMGKRIIQKH